MTSRLKRIAYVLYIVFVFWISLHCTGTVLYCSAEMAKVCFTVCQCGILCLCGDISDRISRSTDCFDVFLGAIVAKNCQTSFFVTSLLSVSLGRGACLREIYQLHSPCH